MGRASGGHQPCGKAGADTRPAARWRADRRHQLRAQASLAYQGRPVGARGLARRARDAGHIGCAGRRTGHDRLRPDRPRPRPASPKRGRSSRGTVSPPRPPSRRHSAIPRTKRPSRAIQLSPMRDSCLPPRREMRCAPPPPRPPLRAMSRLSLDDALEGEAREVAAEHARLALMPRHKASAWPSSPAAN